MQKRLIQKDHSTGRLTLLLSAQSVKFYIGRCQFYCFIVAYLPKYAEINFECFVIVFCFSAAANAIETAGRKKYWPIVP